MKLEWKDLKETLYYYTELQTFQVNYIQNKTKI